MVFNPEIHHRRSIRLKEYDYAQPGAYFVTICTKQHVCILGNIIDENAELNNFGNIVLICWNRIPKHFQNVALDGCIIMPNHIHAVINIIDSVGAGSPRPETTIPINTGKKIEHPRNKNILGKETSPLRSLGEIIAYFKYQSTKRINKFRQTPGIHVWQRNYYEHIIKNEKELYETRKYIHENPLKWDLDKYNPKNT